MKVKEILLLIFIVCAGVFFYHAQTGKIDWEWSFDWGEGLFWNADKFVFEETEEIAPPFPAGIQLLNAHGDVEITGSGVEKISIIFQKNIWRRSEEEAKKVSQDLKMLVHKDGQRLTLSTNRDEFRKRNFKTSFRIVMPAGMDTEVKNSHGFVHIHSSGNTRIKNSHGEVSVSDVNGELELENSYKDVEVKNVQSHSRIQSKHCRIFVQGVKGNLEVSHRHGSINLEDISGETSISGSHSRIKGENLSGPAEIETSHEKVTLLHVDRVKVRNRHSEVQVTGAQGHVEITNQYGGVKLEDIRGNVFIEGKNLGVSGKALRSQKIEITSSYEKIGLDDFTGETVISMAHGKVDLRPAPLTHAIDAKGVYTDITLWWPGDEKYPFEAAAKRGSVEWKLPLPFSHKEEDSLTRVKAFSEERQNPSLSLSTSYGTIKVKQQREDKPSSEAKN